MGHRVSGNLCLDENYYLYSGILTLDYENNVFLSGIRMVSECWTICVRYLNVYNVRRFYCLNLNGTIQNRLSAVCQSNGIWSLFKWYLNGRLFVSSIQMVQFLTKFQTLSGLIFRMGYVLTQKRIQKGPILWFVGCYSFLILGTFLQAKFIVRCPQLAVGQRLKDRDLKLDRGLMLNFDPK